MTEVPGKINSETAIDVVCPTCSNTMPADALVTLGARASAGMVLTPKRRNILFPASEELKPIVFSAYWPAVIGLVIISEN